MRKDAPSTTERLPRLRLEGLTRVSGNFWGCPDSLAHLKALGRRYEARAVHVRMDATNVDYVKLLRGAGFRPIIHEAKAQTADSEIDWARRMFSGGQISVERPCEEAGLDIVRQFAMVAARAELESDRAMRLGTIAARGIVR